MPILRDLLDLPPALESHPDGRRIIVMHRQQCTINTKGCSLIQQLLQKRSTTPLSSRIRHNGITDMSPPLVGDSP